MPKESQLVKSNTILNYIKQVQKIKVRKSAADSLRSRFNALIKTVIKEAKDLCKEEKKKTIMPRHMAAALEKHLGKRHLSIPEIMDEIKRLSAVELGKLSKQLKNYIVEEKQRSD